MLSENIQQLHDWLHTFTDSTVQMEPETAQGICDILKAAIEDARVLENALIPDNLKIVNLADRIKKAAKPTHSHSSFSPPGGDAA